MKKCPRCGKYLPDDMFAPHTRHCKVCRRDYDWQYRYGLSPKQYSELYLKQGGKCAICGSQLSKDKEYFDVDHNKETGEVRGLLCNSCNRGLGCFKDNPESLEKAIEYLKENERWI